MPGVPVNQPIPKEPTGVEARGDAGLLPEAESTGDKHNSSKSGGSMMLMWKENGGSSDRETAEDDDCPPR